MNNHSVLFRTDHKTAVAIATALESGKNLQAPPGSIDLVGLSDIDLEILGELAIKAVHASGIDATLGMVDIALDSLWVIPDSVAEVFAELQTVAENPENPDLLSDLSELWIEHAELTTTPQHALDWIGSISVLAGELDEESLDKLYYICL